MPRPVLQAESGLLSQPWSEARFSPVPLLPAVAEQPACVWMPIATPPLLSRITGEPELPPVVSVW